MNGTISESPIVVEPPRVDAALASAPEIPSPPINESSKGSPPTPLDESTADSQPADDPLSLKGETDVSDTPEAVPSTSTAVNLIGDIGEPVPSPVKQDAALLETAPESEASAMAAISGATVGDGISANAAPAPAEVQAKEEKAVASDQVMTAQPEEVPAASKEVTPEEIAAEGEDAPAKKGKAKRKKKKAAASATEGSAVAVTAPAESPMAEEAVAVAIKPPVEAVAVVVDPPAEVVVVKEAAVSKAATSTAAPTTELVPDASNTVPPPSTPLAGLSAAPDTPPAKASSGVRAAPETSSGTSSKGVALYPHDELREGCTWPDDVDPACREQHLADDEFAAAMGTSKDVFATLPAWRQLGLKKKAGLF